MPQMDESLRANIEKVFSDLEELCLSDFYREARLFGEKSPREIEEGPYNTLDITIGPIYKQFSDFGLLTNSRSFKKGSRGIWLMEHCLREAGLEPRSCYAWKDVDATFSIELPGEEATLEKLGIARLHAQLFNRISQIFHKAIADVAETLGPERIKEIRSHGQEEDIQRGPEL